MPRTAIYIGASVAASAAVILRAFHERPNFYSATVYLGQSTACRMILLNMLLLTIASSMYGLQRFLYGPLRAIEVEQLWDKAWYAITETALAMTTFRDEVGSYFFIMFMTLLAGKVWGWIAEGRVDTLEQQPPANPKTFHARMITSLIISEVFDLVMLRYCARAILDQKAPRAGMMVMFVFEFAILAINSTSTVARYALALQERYTIQKQTRVKINERKEEIRIAREEARRLLIEQNTEGQTIPPPVPVTDDEVDENEIDVPGWQEKGVYILFLDLATDFLKLVFYMAFFMIIFFFAGIPIHMFRDLFITTRSFLKRISDYLKYRNATRDMNARYPDATQEELERDGTCIICREEMRPWVVPETGAANAAPGARANTAPPDERRRPKKLPCGHILHVSCLRSWLERQQVCPTCRRSVLAPGPSSSSTSNPQNRNQPQPNAENRPNPPGQAANNAGNGQAQGPNQQAQNGQRPNHGLRARTINLGIARLTFATGNAQQVQHALQQVRDRPGGNGGAHDGIRDVLEAVNARDGNVRNANNTGVTLQAQVNSMERHIMNEINRLGVAQTQLATVRALQTELSRLRLVQNNPAYTDAAPNGVHQSTQQPTIVPQQRSFVPPHPMTAQHPQMQHVHGLQQQVLGSQAQQGLLGPGNADLPDGMTLPQGWSLLPLQRLGPGPQAGAQISQPADPPEATVVEQAPYEVQAEAEGEAQPTVVNHTSAVTQQLPVVDEPTQSQAIQAPATPSSAQNEQPPYPIAQSNQDHTVNGHNVPSTEPFDAESNNESEPQLFTGLPDWGADPSLGLDTAQDDHDTTASNVNTSSRNPPSDTASSNQHDATSMNGSARVDKGKGRAVTVEEEPDREG